MRTMNDICKNRVCKKRAPAMLRAFWTGPVDGGSCPPLRRAPWRAATKPNRVEDNMLKQADEALSPWRAKGLQVSFIPGTRGSDGHDGLGFNSIRVHLPEPQPKSQKALHFGSVHMKEYEVSC